MLIPKIIHQTVRDKAAIHPVFSENISKIKCINPGWEHKLYDDRDIYEFISSNYDSSILDAYQSINPIYGAAKADFFRYLLIYKCGGVYLDIKSTVTKKLDLVLKEDDQFLLSHWANGPGEPYRKWGLHRALGPRGEYQQWHIVAAPGHPFLEEVIFRVTKNISNYGFFRHGVGKPAVMKITGPLAYTLAIQAAKERGNYRVVDIRDLGFEYSIFGFTLNSLAHEKYFQDHYGHLNELLVRNLSRNDPCPCGSGEKYKKCHGMTN